jgi:hypothetical protein
MSSINFLNINPPLTRDVLVEKAPFLVKYLKDDSFYLVREFMNSELIFGGNIRDYRTSCYKVSRTYDFKGFVYYFLEKKDCEIILNNGRKLYSFEEIVHL